jgi:hypothetical protein
LNASSILIDLVELEKTRDFFFENDASRIGDIIDLALDS